MIHRDCPDQGVPSVSRDKDILCDFRQNNVNDCLANICPGYWQLLKAQSTLILLALGRATIKVQDCINSIIATNFEENTMIS